MPNRSDVDIISHGGSGGKLAAEWYASDGFRQAAYAAYTDAQTGTYGTGEIYCLGSVADEQRVAYPISWTAEGIDNHLSVISLQAILYASYCYSCDSRAQWGLDLEEPYYPDGGSIFCTSSAVGTHISLPCDDLYCVMLALGCGYLDVDSTVGDAAKKIVGDKQLYGDEENSYHLEMGCNNLAPVTTVGFAVAPPGGRVRVTVYDVAGREVAVLVDGEYSPGWYGAVWDGCGSAGIRVASGVYFMRMYAPGYVGHGKMVLVE